MIEAYSVSRLARLLKELLESDPRLSNIWVEGEISNLSRSAAGHTYFTLKDESAQVRCVMFRRVYSGAPLENGQQVQAHGYVSFYEVRGDLQFYVDAVYPAGIGVWQAEFERLKSQLAAEGLFEPARKRPLPEFPRRVGVVTSPTGAVFHDICNVISRRWPLAEVVLAPTPVQGADAAAGIVAALGQLNEEPAVDVIIVGRGGGSIEELWPFNEESVARAIYASRVPVISGVGHETDYTIADYVADVRAPTPSSAAELAVPDRLEVGMRLSGLAAALSIQATGQVRRRLMDLEQKATGLRQAVPDIGKEQEGLAALVGRAGSALAQAVGRYQEGVNGFALQLRSLDPRNTLARGYAIVQLRSDGRVVRSVGDVTGRDRLDVQVQDGRFPAEVARQYGF